MQKCTTCKIEYPSTAEFFYKYRHAKNGLEKRCKRCDNRKREANREKAKAKLKSGPCADCRQTFPPCAMSFDHLPGYTKRFVISRSKINKLALQEELDKCELVCLNCHAIRTRDRALNPDEPIDKSRPAYDVLIMQEAEAKFQAAQDARPKYPARIDTTSSPEVH